MPTINIPGISVSREKSGSSADKLTMDSSLLVTKRQPKKTIFVELDDKPAKANVVRDGYRVPSVTPDINRKGELLGRLTPQPPTSSPRVLDQSIAAGTKVGAGTEIDLVLTPRENVIIGIFDDVHMNMKEESVADLLEKIKDQNQLLDLAFKYEKADEVPETEKEIMSKLMTENAGMVIDETKDGQRFNNGFNTIRAALAFK